MHSSQGEENNLINFIRNYCQGAITVITTVGRAACGFGGLNELHASQVQGLVLHAYGGAKSNSTGNCKWELIAFALYSEPK